MLPPKTKRFIRQVVPFGIIWCFFAFIYVFIEKGLLGEIHHYPSTGNLYNYKSNLFIIPTVALFFGLTVLSQYSFTQKRKRL